MIDGYKVITLCGSTKFKEFFLAAQAKLTLMGYIVLSTGVFSHSGDELPNDEQTKKMLADLHKKKIDMSDEIMVINVDGYIGESTKSEILYAAQQGKVIRYAFTCYGCENFVNSDDKTFYCEASSFYVRRFSPACENYIPLIQIPEAEFVKRFCHKCGSQRCEGISTECFDGCQYKRYLKEGKDESLYSVSLIYG